MKIFDTSPCVLAAESTRLGGVSPAPFDSLNLGMSSGDDQANVLENRMRFFGKHHVALENVALVHQVHGTSVLCVTTGGNYGQHDALMTNTPNVFVAVSTADCTPILIYDAVSKACAAVHAGWRGTESGVVCNTLLEMQRQFGSLPEHIFAYIGACIGETAFEVGRDVADKFDAAFKRFDPEQNKFLIDLKKANFAQLKAFGVAETHIEVSPHCTVINNDRYFSYRKEAGRTGRMLTFIGQRG
jgi:YfiH family protein